MTRKYATREKQGTLIRKINNMMPVPEVTRTAIALSLLVRVSALELAPCRLDAAMHDMVRHLIGDLSTMSATVEELAGIFEAEVDIRRQCEATVEALQRTAACWKLRLKPAASDLACFKKTIDLLDEMLRQTQLGEYKAALARVAARLS